MRRFSFALALLLVAPVALSATLLPRVAQAQVSDSERAAARQLFTEGNELQSAGKYEEALDKFQRAQRVFSAPTNLLRIAQCQAMIGKIVESAETYRTLIRTPLPAGSPAAFSQAVEQAKVELGQVEPRVPTVKLEVSPANVPNMQVQLNGQSLNSALVGEPLPLDPGTHKFLVFAPGYASSEQTITLKERDKKVLSFTLKSTGGVAYGPGGVAPLPNPADDPQKGNGGNSGNGGPPPPPPPPDQWQAAKKPASSSILLGVRLGASIPTGDIYKDNAGTSYAISDTASAGGAIALEGGLRFGRSFYIGLFLEGASFSKGSKIDDNFKGYDSATASSAAFGALLAYISNPNGVGFFGEIGVDYRSFSQTVKFPNASISGSVSGGEFLIGAGVHILAARMFRIIPKVEVTIGSFGKPTCDATGARCIVNEANFNSSSHAFVFIGVGGYYNIDLR